MASATLTQVHGVRVGHATARGGRTGVTAILFEGPAPTVVDVRGGASGTYDTASLALDATFGGRCGLFFSGGSQFGLDAGRGVRSFILDTGGGVEVFGHPTKIAPVSGAVLFDLPSGAEPLADYLALGYEAARSAAQAPVPTGRVGAGAGGTVGKYLGRGHAMTGGLASKAAMLSRSGRVGALVVVNSVGAIYDDRRSRWLAGAVDPRGRIRPPGSRGGADHQGTTLVAVVTDLPAERRELARLAIAAHDGLARAVRPAHTATDGDVVFATSTAMGRRRGPDRRPGEFVDRAGALVAELVRDAVLAVGRHSIPVSRRADAT
jgi:L-aminopeptidase/D-esterase-like protein